MLNPFRPVSISLSPNVQPDDVRLAFSVIRDRQKWQTGPEIYKLQDEFKKYLGVKHAYSFNSGRSSLMAIMQALVLPKGSQVLLQALTCNAAVNPIRWAGLEPVYVDCDENYNLSVVDLKKKITPRARAVMVQHTFGLPADMAEIKKICDENNLILIEDCAHSLGATYGGGTTRSPRPTGRPVGTFGKAAFFSLSRDKVISCVYGGMVVTDDDELAQRVSKFQQECGYPDNKWINQQLLHPILMDKLILPIYSIGGKYKLVVLQWFHVLSKAIHWKEKQGLQPDYFPKRLPNALAILALNQFQKLDKYNQHRQKIAHIYFEALKDRGFVLPPTPAARDQIFLRFVVRRDDATKIIKKAWSKNLLLGDWYRTPVDPFDTLPQTVGYKKGSCPNAEKFAGKMINLPTHINISEVQARDVAKFAKHFK
jgi:perosamine synthetase